MSTHTNDWHRPDHDARARARLSKWINEPCPEWTTLLTAREVAKLTRRPRCLLSALAFLGRLPPPKRYRGKALGWQRRDIERWLASRGPSEPGALKLGTLGRTLREKGRCRSRRIDRGQCHGR